MKNKIKVYLQYPWKFPDSPYYKYLIQDPQKGIEYLNTKKQKGVITNKIFFWFSNFLKRNIRRFTKILNLSISNAHLSPKGDYDLIHCAHCLSKNKDKPWVADIESEWQMYVGNKNKRINKKIKKILSQKNCKKILPWTESTKNEILKSFPKLKNKIEVVYPSIPENNFKKKAHQRINLLFIGRYFYWKGGLHALEIIDKLTKKYKNVFGTIVSEVPKEIFNEYSKNKKITFSGLVSQKKVLKIYSNTDILIYPGYSDSFGFAYLEAMSFGLPTITINTEGTKSRKEIIENNKTGFIFDVNEKLSFDKIGENEEKVINKLVKYSSILIENSSLRKKMSKNCLDEIKNGKFSIKERNNKLKRIYENSLN